MPLETRDHDPYRNARNALGAQQLEDMRNKARQTVNERGGDLQAEIDRLIMGTAKAAGAAGSAIQAEFDDQVAGVQKFGKAFDHRMNGQGPEKPRATNPVARWAEGRVGKDGYNRLDTAPDARGPKAQYLKLKGIFDPKCNQFVWDAIHAGGAPAGRMKDGRIPLAGEWGDASQQIAGYSIVTGPLEPGDVVSNGHHMGIYSPLADGRPGVVSAASPLTKDGGALGGVVHNQWGVDGRDGKLTVRRAITPTR